MPNTLSEVGQVLTVQLGEGRQDTMTACIVFLLANFALIATIIGNSNIDFGQILCGIMVSGAWDSLPSVEMMKRLSC